MTQGIMTRTFVFALALLLSGPEILAQNSTGGTLGKTDQSLSGGTEKAPRKLDRTAPDKQTRGTSGQEAFGCRRLPGVWAWWANDDVTIRADGTAVQKGTSLTGTWTRNNNQVVIVWSHGFKIA
jgi:hypothetical protein